MYDLESYLLTQSVPRDIMMAHLQSPTRQHIVINCNLNIYNIYIF